MKKGKKRICVIGLGQFGSEMARQLAKHCEVLALDMDEDRVNALADEVQQALIVDAKDYATLSSLVSHDYDEAVVSLGESMEASILCTLHLKKIGVPVIRAKAISEDHASILRSVGGTETIFPERETAQRIASQIINPNLLDFIPLAEGFEVIDVAPPDDFYGHTLQELNLRERFGAFVIGVKELVPPKFVFLPGPDFIVKPSDVLVVIGHHEVLNGLKGMKV
ncbi:MAG: TrkA family potassium uptake protein [Thermodesulfobacteriota bacterium]|nr:TrkA family potassium uptake protein [Thermodesulfobacteriota bacterium]